MVTMGQTSDCLSKLKVLKMQKFQFQLNKLLYKSLKAYLFIRRRNYVEENLWLYLKAHWARDLLSRSIPIIITGDCDLWDLFHWISRQTLGPTSVKDVGSLIIANFNSTHLVEDIDIVSKQQWTLLILDLTSYYLSNNNTWLCTALSMAGPILSRTSLPLSRLTITSICTIQENTSIGH